MKPLPLGDDRVLLDDRIAEALRPRDGLRISPEKPFHWAYLAPRRDPIRFTVDSDDEIFETVVLTIWNWHNRPVFRSQFPAGEQRLLELLVKGRGVYQFTLDGYESGECRKRLVRSFAVTEDLNHARDTWNSNEFFLGVCAFPGRYHWSFKGESTLPEGIYSHGARKVEADLVARLGFQVVRIDESMKMGLPREGGSDTYEYDFKRMDAAVDAYTSRGMKLAFQIMNAPDWAIHPKYSDVDTDNWRYPRKESHQRAYISVLLERYGKHAQFVQIFNEPDQPEFWAGETGEYIDQFQYSRDEIRKHETGRGLPVANGGYSLFERDKTILYAEKLRGQIDLVAYHCHGKLEELIEDFAFIKQIHEKAGYTNPRFINSEMGFDGWRLDQELRKGQFVPQKTLYCWASGHAGALLFGSRMTLGASRQTQDFGFLDHFFCPRYVYGSVGAMVSALAGASFDSVLSEDDNLFVYLFKREDEKIIAAFTRDESAKLEIVSDAEKAERIDEMGNREGVKNPPSVLLELTNYPVYLRLEGVRQIECRKSPSPRSDR